MFCILHTMGGYRFSLCRFGLHQEHAADAATARHVADLLRVHGAAEDESGRFVFMIVFMFHGLPGLVRCHRHRGRIAVGGCLGLALGLQEHAADAAAPRHVADLLRVHGTAEDQSGGFVLLVMIVRHGLRGLARCHGHRGRIRGGGRLGLALGLQEHAADAAAPRHVADLLRVHGTAEDQTGGFVLLVMIVRHGLWDLARCHGHGLVFMFMLHGAGCAHGQQDGFYVVASGAPKAGWLVVAPGSQSRGWDLAICQLQIRLHQMRRVCLLQ